MTTEELDRQYQEFIARVHLAEEWIYLTVKAGRMARKSDLDAWLMKRYNLSEYDARQISNQTTEGLRGERRPWAIGSDGIRWLANRPEPEWKIE